MDPRTSAQDVMRCDLCEIPVAREQMHCDTCLVNLCTPCVGKHFSADLSKRHIIVDFKDRKSTPTYPLCKTHTKERCEMYYKQCDIPVCISCLASNQHLGHELSKVSKVFNEGKEIITQEQNELNQTIYPMYRTIASDVQNRISQIKKEYGDLSTAITKNGEDWHREIDKLVKKLNAEVDEMKNTQLQTLQKHLDEINKTMSDIKDEINTLEIVLDTNDLSELFSVRSNLYSYRNIPNVIVPSLPKLTLEKFQEEDICKLFGALSFTSLTPDEHDNSMKTTQKSPEAGPSNPVKNILDEPETVTTKDTGYDKLNNVECLGDEEIWTRGQYDNTIKLYSINQGSLLKSITTKSGNWPSNITVTKSVDLVYTDSYNRTVNIVKKRNIKEMIRLYNWRPSGVCSTSSGDLLVIMYCNYGKPTKVVRYSGSEKRQTAVVDNKGKHLYSPGSSDKYITENRNMDICVSDCGANAVVVVNQAGKVRFRYTGHNTFLISQLFNPRGITTDSQSHILTADFNNDCVHIIDQDGQFLRYIDCGLMNPWGLCTDTNDNLFVAQLEDSQVMKIKYLQ